MQTAHLPQRHFSQTLPFKIWHRVSDLLEQCFIRTMNTESVQHAVHLKTKCCIISVPPCLICRGNCVQQWAWCMWLSRKSLTTKSSVFFLKISMFYFIIEGTVLEVQQVHAHLRKSYLYKLWSFDRFRRKEVFPSYMGTSTNYVRCWLFLPHHPTNLRDNFDLRSYIFQKNITVHFNITVERW